MKRRNRIVGLILSVVIVLSACGTQQPVVTEPEATKTAEQILSERRDLAEEKMRWAMTVLWRTDEDITYSTAGTSFGLSLDDQSEIINLKSGRIYRGLPFTHGSGSVYSFLSCAQNQDSNGVYNLSSMDSPLLSGGHTNTSPNISRLGSDCADSVFWAWGHISSSITYFLTRNMTEMTGCLKVGNYSFSELGYTQTRDDCKRNGEEVMFAAYAKTQKADAVVKYNKGGHAMMVVETHVVKNGDSIDPDQSYVTVLEQITSNLKKEEHYYDNNLKEDVYLCGGVDIKYTFRQLFDQGYLPVTCQELIDPSPLAKETITDSEKNRSKDNMFKGTFTSNYRISSVTVTITDTDNKTVQQLTGFGIETEMKRIRLSRFISADEKEVVQGFIDLNALPSGTYRCTYTCQVSTGNVITVSSFDFHI